MPSTCGVTWDGTSSGKLDKSAIPDDDFESHYLNSGDTKSDSSFPVVDANGNLRAGNVNSAWDLRNNGEGVSEECLRKLDNAFDEDVLPDSAYENSVMLEGSADDTYAIALDFQAPAVSELGDGFNEHGVRVNDDGSVDVRFNAMEPGVRRGVEITTEFLRNVARRADGKVPVQLDHSASQRANVGIIDPGNIQFGGDFLQVQAHVPNTGSSIRDDVIADFTHEPPQIQDISVSFQPDSVEVETPDKRGEPPKFTDAEIREFSLTPFPAGYDSGGLTPAFSEAVEKVTYTEPEDDPAGTDYSDAESKLTTQTRKLITRTRYHD